MEQDLSGIKKVFGKYEEGFKRQEQKEPYDQENILNFTMFSTFRMLLEHEEQIKAFKVQISELDAEFRNLARKYNELQSAVNSKMNG